MNIHPLLLVGPLFASSLTLAPAGVLGANAGVELPIDPDEVPTASEARLVQRIGVIDIVVNENVRGIESQKGRSRYEMTSRFHDLDEAMDRDIVLLSGEAKMEGCFVDERLVDALPELVPSDLPERYIAKDMSIGLTSADETLSLESPAHRRWRFSESDAELTQSGSQTAAQRPGRGNRPSGQANAAGNAGPKLVGRGARLKLRGRGFGKLGDVPLPDAPSLDLKAGNADEMGNGKGKGNGKGNGKETLRTMLRSPDRLSLTWTPIADPTSRVGIELALIGATPDGEEDVASEETAVTTLTVTCHVPDTGQFEMPVEFGTIVRAVAPTDVHLRVSRTTEAWTQDDLTLLRTIVHTVAEAEQ